MFNGNTRTRPFSLFPVVNPHKQQHCGHVEISSLEALGKLFPDSPAAHQSLWWLPL